MNWWQGLLFFGLTSPVMYICVFLLLSVLVAVIVRGNELTDREIKFWGDGVIIGSAFSILAWWIVYFVVVLKW